jgi:hypothetical protein
VNLTETHDDSGGISQYVAAIFAALERAALRSKIAAGVNISVRKSNQITIPLRFALSSRHGWRNPLGREIIK